MAERRKHSSHLVKAGYELLHDLKHNVVTPYVMVEALAGFSCCPSSGKRSAPLVPSICRLVKSWLCRRSPPP